MDRISDLPDVAIEGIIGKLPLVDQVRTSVLSSCWRHRWAKIPLVVIDMKFYEFLSPSRFKPCKQKLNTKPPLITDFLSVINSILMQHIGHLREFSLLIPSWAQGFMEGFHIPLHFVLRNGVDSLSVINFVCGSKSFILPVFSGVGLKHLKLQNCYLRLPPAFDGFPNLISFTQTSLSDQFETISYLISSCPVIEEVELVLNSCDEVLDIHAPRLNSLVLSGWFKSISLNNPQKIETLELYYYECPDVSSVDLNYFHFMNNLKYLALGNYTYKILARCTDLPRLGQLNEMILYDMCFHDIDHLNCLLSLGTSASNLEYLDITGSFQQADDKVEYQSFIKNYSNHIFDHLHSVSIEGIHGSKTEMSIIELLLCGSPLLKSMSIKVASFIDTSEKLSILELILGFCRASPKAKVEIMK